MNKNLISPVRLDTLGAKSVAGSVQDYVTFSKKLNGFNMV